MPNKQTKKTKQTKTHPYQRLQKLGARPQRPLTHQNPPTLRDLHQSPTLFGGRRCGRRQRRHLRLLRRSGRRARRGRRQRQRLVRLLGATRPLLVAHQRDQDQGHKGCHDKKRGEKGHVERGEQGGVWGVWVEGVVGGGEVAGRGHLDGELGRERPVAQVGRVAAEAGGGGVGHVLGQAVPVACKN